MRAEQVRGRETCRRAVLACAEFYAVGESAVWSPVSQEQFWVRAVAVWLLTQLGVKRRLILEEFNRDDDIVAKGCKRVHMARESDPEVLVETNALLAQIRKPQTQLSGGTN